MQQMRFMARAPFLPPNAHRRFHHPAHGMPFPPHPGHHPGHYPPQPHFDFNGGPGGFDPNMYPSPPGGRGFPGEPDFGGMMPLHNGGMEDQDSPASSTMAPSGLSDGGPTPPLMHAFPSPPPNDFMSQQQQGQQGKDMTPLPLVGPSLSAEPCFPSPPLSQEYSSSSSSSSSSLPTGAMQMPITANGESS
jgi:hypothetical protein